MNAEQLKPKAIKASERFLESRGYEILETSWECAAGGADIIARDDAAVVFVEVNQDGRRGGLPGGGGHRIEARQVRAHRDRLHGRLRGNRRVRPLRHHLDGGHRRKPRDAPPPHQRTVSRSGLTTSGPFRASSGPPGRPRRACLRQMSPNGGCGRGSRAWGLLVPKPLRQDAKASCTCRGKAVRRRFSVSSEHRRNQIPFNIERYLIQ